MMAHSDEHLRGARAEPTSVIFDPELCARVGVGGTPSPARPCGGGDGHWTGQQDRGTGTAGEPATERQTNHPGSPWAWTDPPRAGPRWPGRAGEAVRRGLPLRAVYACSGRTTNCSAGRTGDEQARWARTWPGRGPHRHRPAPGPAGDDRGPGRRRRRLAAGRGRGGPDVVSDRCTRHDRRLPARFRRPAGDRQAPCPVVLARAGDRAASEASGREIVVGQQGGPDDSAAGLRFAFETAAARGAGVRAVRAWSLPPVFAYSPGSLRLLDEAGGLEPYAEEGARRGAPAVAGALPTCRSHSTSRWAAPGRLLSLADRAQLMVVGRRAHHSAVGARIGSATHAVMHHAPCPVAVVPHS